MDTPIQYDPKTQPAQPQGKTVRVPQIGFIVLGVVLLFAALFILLLAKSSAIPAKQAAIPTQKPSHLQNSFPQSVSKQQAEKNVREVVDQNLHIGTVYTVEMKGDNDATWLAIIHQGKSIRGMYVVNKKTGKVLSAKL